MIQLGHCIVTGQGEFKTSVSPEELVDDPGSPFHGHACSPFSAIMGPHDSENNSLPDLVSVTDSSLGSDSVDVDLGICQLCFEIHPHTPWDCPLFGITESQKANRSRESGTAVGSNTSAEKVGDGSSPDESECVPAVFSQDSLAVNQEAEEVCQAFKDFTTAFDTPENENEKEFWSVVDVLEHEAADGLRALAAGLRVEHAVVDKLREIEDGLRWLEIEERTADPRPLLAFHFNPRVGDAIIRDAWSSSASASLESLSLEPLTPYDNDDHNTYRVGNENFMAEELEIRNFYKLIFPGDRSPAISDWSVEEFDLFPPFRPNPAHIIDLTIGRALNEQYLSGSRSPSNLDSDNSREDVEAAAEFLQSDFSPRLGSRNHCSDQIRLELQSWTYKCSAHRLPHLQHEDEMGSEPANAALCALHSPLSKFVDYVAMAAEGVTDLCHPPSPPLFLFPWSAPPKLTDQIYEDEESAGQYVGALESSGDTGTRDIEGERSETWPKVGMKRKLSDREAEEGMRKCKSPKTSVHLALLETGSRLEDLVWHRYRAMDMSINGVWKLFRSEAGEHLSEEDNVSEELQYPATDDESSDDECHHPGPGQCRRCGRRLTASCPALADPGTNALGLAL
ncbi:hypothetical protein DFH08DRAFT_800937 [Mycena albidolilacea]|uniref:Uncharacterized protein n=1 Tax=Mycena albidolilacea TaxID=1033008 RepID=A0AAD7F281_9AGAR|nr:hypothetical protein DFH08DRAFT_800937 [Mycena albidolilacea]